MANLAEKFDVIHAEYIKAVELGDSGLLPAIMTKWCDLFFLHHSEIKNLFARAEGGTMRGAKSCTLEYPSETRAVKDRHLYVMDKDGLWFHFEPKPSLAGPDGGHK